MSHLSLAEVRQHERGVLDGPHQTLPLLGAEVALELEHSGTLGALYVGYLLVRSVLVSIQVI